LDKVERRVGALGLAQLGAGRLGLGGRRARCLAISLRLMREAIT
jgi:hypothetical protein